MKSIHDFKSVDQYKEYLRTYFAAMAMNGLLYHSIYPMSEETYAKKSVALSDELLKQLEDGNNKS